MIKAVIFDCFGVLTTDGWMKFRKEYLDEGTAEDSQAAELNHQADTGYLSHAEFERSVAELANVELETARRVIDTHVPNEQLFDYISTNLKPKYLIGLLSNVASDITGELFSKQQNKLFDATLFSFEIGVTKPHLAMYSTIATRLGVLTEECLFIDDRELFVTGARESGMESFQYKNYQQFVEEIQLVLN